MIFILAALVVSCSRSGSTVTSPPAVGADSFEPPAASLPMIVMHSGEGAFGGASYTLSIWADGKVQYDPHYTQSMNDAMSGKKTLPSPTPATWRISAEQVRTILDEFAKADFLNWGNRYQYAEDGCPSHAEDFPNVEITLSLRDKEKKVAHNLGCREVNSGPPYPRALKDLEAKIEQIAFDGHTK